MFKHEVWRFRIPAQVIAQYIPSLVEYGRCAYLTYWRQGMSRFIIALFLLMAAQQANAAECGSSANRAGCVGPNGAASYNKNTGAVHSAQPYHSNEVAPGR